MKRVVRTNQKFRACLDELVRRRQQQASGFVPAICLDMPHVLCKGVRVHRDLRMIVRAEKGGAFHTYRAIAERRALSTYRNDSDVPGVLHLFSCSLIATCLNQRASRPEACGKS